MTVEQWRGTGRELAERILLKRPRHLIVISRDAHRSHLFLDAEEVARQTSGIADVVLVENGPTTYQLEEHLPPGHAVYGNAGRVYPGDMLGHSHRLPSVPILAERADLVPQRTQDLINVVDGLPVLRREHQRTAAAPRRVTGTVVGVHENGSAAYVILADRTMAQLNQDELFPGVRLDWYVPEGLQLTGTLHDGRFDVGGELVRQQIMDAYSYGDLILALVKKVRDDHAYLEPLPGEAIRVTHHDVTTNDQDCLQDLLEVGEVVVARLVSKKGRQRLTLHDVNDDEEPLPSPTLIAGGTPWLVYGRNLPPKEYDAATPADADTPPEVASVPEVDDGPDAGIAPAAEPAGGADATEQTGEPTGPRFVAPELTAELQGQLGELSTGVEELMREIGPLKALLTGAQRGVVGGSSGRDEDLRERLGEQQSEIKRLREEVDRHKQQVRDARRRAKGGKEPAQQRGLRVDAFQSREEALRHEVYLAWVDRVDASQKRHFPLPEHYDVGPKFMDSFVELQPDQQAKTLKALVDILTGQAASISSRQVHPLRTGDGGDDPQTVREDGAKCFRASVEVNAPSARRVHYWKLPDGTIELHEVVVHDKTTT